MRTGTRLLLLLLLAVTTPALAQNKFGVMTHLTAPSYDIGAAARYMENASRMAGDWGWVRQYVTADPNEIDSDITYLLLARAHRLTPVLYIQDLAEEHVVYHEDRSLKPRPDADGGYSAVAASVAEWVRRVEAAGVQIPYLELWNEPNLGYGWAQQPDPAEYARYHMAVARAVREVSPETIILNAALSPSSGTEDNGDGRQGEVGDKNLDSFYFIHRMMETEPELPSMIDLWSSHPYPLNQPPTHNASRYTASGHQWELRELDRYDFHPKVLITETGYRLDDQPNMDFPKVTDETRVAWLVWAYFAVWLPDEDVVGVCPFLLGDPLWKETGQWDAYSYIDDAMRARPILDAVASLPRTPGTDYMPAGNGHLDGRSRSSDGSPVERALVYLMPGGYASMTNAEGNVSITGIPPGRYTANIRASGHALKSWPIGITNHGNGYDVLLDNVGLIANGRFEDGFREHAGPLRMPGDASAGRVTIAKGRGVDGTNGVSIAGHAAIYDDTDYLSVEPGKTYAVHICLRQIKESDDAWANVRVSAIPMLSHGPNPAEVESSAWSTIYSSNWQCLSVTVSPRHKFTQRLRVVVEAQTHASEAIIDDLIVYIQKPTEASQTERKVDSQ